MGIALAHRFSSSGGYITWNQGGACPTVGITKKEQKENAIIKVYPNPTTGNFTISNISSKDMQIVLFDALDRILMSTNVKARSEKYIILHLPPAMYFMKGDNGFYYKLLVKE